MSEEQFTLAENGPAARRLKISLSVFKTRPLFNIRYYFENKSGQMQPTNKGIALNRNNYFALHNIITKQHDEISHFLNGENKISSI
ncbi:transcriptional coactivator p15/PC4 family protein, partial [bacterium]|nr:transcriptional coactivator p15/PC4 family protein [bacterium]